ncbi:PP2C family serine/threonine-protein phosphatase [Alteribacter populi]|uniref:PP2C family serine/threonine-protein phosphatase n=1 Tax=Alteribacter populi TaxID=2011011 RepID=UPI000BBAA3C5|nr:PP2C family serine/threonine-protein phosphatase [Alteribacter populi]
MIKHHQLNGIDVTSYHTAKRGNWCSGDAYHISSGEGHVICAIVDGLGSGEEAMKASQAVIQVIEMDQDEAIEELMSRCNNALREKRGAVLTIIKVDMAREEIIYSNVGNIGCIFYSPSGKLVRPIPTRGYVSGKRQKFKSQRYQFEKGMTFLLYSDGLSFDPAFHTFMMKMTSTNRAMQQVVEMMAHNADDTTILIGKVPAL